MRAVTLFALACFSASAMAYNKPNVPCSGKKRGISHCDGKAFVCRAGSRSQSKKDCQAFTGKSTKPAPGK